jgi:hypothetical protein
MEVRFEFVYNNIAVSFDEFLHRTSLLIAKAKLISLCALSFGPKINLLNGKQCHSLPWSRIDQTRLSFPSFSGNLFRSNEAQDFFVFPFQLIKRTPFAGQASKADFAKPSSCVSTKNSQYNCCFIVDEQEHVFESE